MALIGTIRKNSWILIALMTLALGGFVLMDIISNIQRYDQGGANTVGKVNGKEIDYRRFSEYERTVYPNARDNALGLFRGKRISERRSGKNWPRHQP